MTSVAAFDEAELLCTVVSIPIRAVLSCLKGRNQDFAPAIEDDQIM
jgi:hypothetical protein